MEIIISIFLYIAIFIIGLLLDSKSNNSKIRKLYVFGLYIFLCFSYTSGSDWRSYELFYQGAISITISPLELGSKLIFDILPDYITDFWIIAGLFKCLYLSSFFIIAKILTKYWLSVSVLSMYLSLLFILINCPFRFMIGITMINYYLYFIIRRNYKLSILFLVLAFIFHNSTILYLIFIPVFLFVDKIAYLKKSLFLIIYLLILLITFDTGYINKLMGHSIMLLQSTMDIKDYTSSYQSESTEAIFSVGNVIKMVIFCLILLKRDVIINSNKYGKYIYVLSLFYLLIYRVACVLPTGFRIALPFAVFYATGIIVLVKNKIRFAKIVLLYFSLSFTKNVYSSFSYIPYTNSIPYIITGHMPYSIRSEYNVVEYENFFGKPVNKDEQ